jgi:hypothetical protein
MEQDMYKHFYTDDGVMIYDCDKHILQNLYDLLVSDKYTAIPGKFILGVAVDMCSQINYKIHIYNTMSTDENNARHWSEHVEDESDKYYDLYTIIQSIAIDCESTGYNIRELILPVCYAITQTRLKIAFESREWSDIE